MHRGGAGLAGGQAAKGGAGGIAPGAIGEDDEAVAAITANYGDAEIARGQIGLACACGDDAQVVPTSTSSMPTSRPALPVRGRVRVTPLSSVTVAVSVLPLHRSR